MYLSFTKMQGCGNDYVYINGFDEKVQEVLTQHSLESLAKSLSDRHFGVGSDGLIGIFPSDQADATMRMFNLDGSEGKMCGNGIRCVAKYLFDYGIVAKDTITVETRSGIKTLFLTIENNQTVAVRVDMGAPILTPSEIPVALEGSRMIAHPLSILGKQYDLTGVSMGNPHAVVFVDEVQNLDLQNLGPLFEHNALFPEQVNTEFVQVLSKTHLKMRVWERGSGETLACGTGACATVVAAVLGGHCEQDTDVTVDLLGGSLVIRYTEQTVFMTGGCVTVFEGIVAL